MTNVEEIKSRLNIIEIMQERLKLRRTGGANYMASCPFHADKTPSLSISADKGVWHCFSCSRGGDIFTFLMEADGLEFRDALEVLARRAGVEVKKENPAEKSRRGRLLEIHRQAAKYFQAALAKTKGGVKAQEYLTKRGMTAQSLADFQIGFAPFAWEGLSKALVKRGFSEYDLVDSGLCLRSQKVGQGGRIYDRFRSRIMFPITDQHGDIIAFSGRIFEAGMPAADRARAAETGKYINSPNTAIYEKRRVLFGFDKARAAIREQRRVILLEGNIDVVLSHQTGVLEAVATCGTALGPEHLQQLTHLTEEIVLCFDADAAGSKATRRAASLILQSAFEVSAVVLPAGQDPADVITANSAAWPKLVQDKQELMAYFFEQGQALYDLASARGKRDFAAYIFEPLIWANVATRDHWLQQIAQKTFATLDGTYAEFQKFQTAKAKETKFESVSVEKTESGPIKRSFLLECEENLLALALKYPKVARPFLAALEPDVFTTAERQRLWQGLKSGAKGAVEDQRTWDKLALRGEHYFGNPNDVFSELATAANFVHNERTKRRLSDLNDRIGRAEASGDISALPTLYTEHAQISRNIFLTPPYDGQKEDPDQENKKSGNQAKKEGFKKRLRPPIRAKATRSIPKKPSPK